MNGTRKKSLFNIVSADLVRNRYLYLMILPVVIWYVVFCYIPMYGIVIAFQDFSIVRGVGGSEWVGFENFTRFFKDPYFRRIIENTLAISGLDLLWGFPAPIILALMLNELKGKIFKKTVQTLTYLPYFISIVVVCGIIKDFVSSNGLITTLLSYIGFEKVDLLGKKEYFRTIYISSGVWQGIGWGSIIYLSALSGIDQELYEAATIDGARKFKQLLYITLPCIADTIIVLLILRIGSLLSVGFEKIILLYNPITYEKADVISSYVYRRGLLEADYSYSAAVGLFNSIINFILLVLANTFSKKFSESSLW